MDCKPCIYSKRLNCIPGKVTSVDSPNTGNTISLVLTNMFITLGNKSKPLFKTGHIIYLNKVVIGTIGLTRKNVSLL